jgi:hypothetical protein
MRLRLARVLGKTWWCVRREPTFHHPGLARFMGREGDADSGELTLLTICTTTTGCSPPAPRLVMSRYQKPMMIVHIIIDDD